MKILNLIIKQVYFDAILAGRKVQEFFASNVFMVKFTNSNSGIGFPTCSSVASNLGISSTTPFSVRVTIICSADSTQEGCIYGRNTSVSGMSTTQHPQRLNNNAGVETGGLAMQGGDINEFQLVWDGTNYRAYHLARRWAVD